jgi:hypothetical protein
VIVPGLFDGFEGYRVVGDADTRQALTHALVAVDANVLLNLYRYNSRTTNDLLRIFERLGDRLVVPHQAAREFHRNRLKAIGNPEQASNEARTSLNKSRDAAIRALEPWSKQVALDEAELHRLHAEVHRVFQTLHDAVDSAAPDRVHASTPTSDDPVLSRLAGLLEGKVLPRPDDEIWDGLVKEGIQRVDDLVPPGFLDAEKGDQHPEGAAGDFLVYIQACQEAQARQLDLVIVTNDEKEDWWWRRGAELIGPRQEMTKEFFDRTGRRLFLLRPSDLLLYSDALQVTVNPDSAKDAGITRSDIDEVGNWTPAAVDTLIERLLGEGRRDLVDVIREAARQGGTISRDEVYALCGYDDERMLRGFTRPTARITAELQAQKLLPASVTPMLTSMYRDAGRLHAVRIPAEVVAILQSPPPVADLADETEVTRKYQPFTDYLRAFTADSARMTFSEIEEILGAGLPPSARRHLPYWYSTQNSLGKAIMDGGFKVTGVRLESESLGLVRRE